ncbi:cytochrome c maturation protein CcmE [Candidatus Palauibacter sp.]|uniref:cytochrome c maturation protein CcmE n=1 Tax=Candidatus Palauibacter sp. TaxID=3101350 RepID=UPI003B01A8DA
MLKNKVWRLIGLAAIAGAITVLAAGGLNENMVFFLTPAELEERAREVTGKPIRLGAPVKPGSVNWNADATELRFVLAEGGVEIPVESTGAPPAMFQEGMGVVVEGVYGEDRVFHATNLMVKHSNEYAPPDHPGDASETYKSLIEGS